MKIYSELNLNNFKPWSGAVSAFERIQKENKLNELEEVLDELYPDGISDTTLNDILWFEEEYLFNLLGIRSEEEIRNEINEKEDELECLMEELEIFKFEFEEETTDLTSAEKTKVFEEEYKRDIDALENDIKELKEEIDELMEELSQM